MNIEVEPAAAVAAVKARAVEPDYMLVAYEIKFKLIIRCEINLLLKIKKVNQADYTPYQHRQI